MDSLSAPSVAQARRLRPLRLRPLRVALVLAVAATLFASSPAHARPQLDAREEPEVSGPLTLAGRRCIPDTIEHEGERVGTSVVCLYVYTYSTLAELDLARDYGVLWLQATVDGVGDWCATDFEASTTMSPPGRFHGIVPRGSTRVSQPRPETVDLTVQAGGLAWSEGALAQDYVQNPRVLSAKQSTKDDWDTLTLRWQGLSGAKHALVGGAEFSWNTLGNFPERILFGVTRYGFIQKPGC